MNKYYLLTICLFLTFFTGCIEDEESSDATVIEETDDTTKNQDSETELVKGCINSTAHTIILMLQMMMGLANSIQMKIVTRVNSRIPRFCPHITVSISSRLPLASYAGLT